MYRLVEANVRPIIYNACDSCIRYQKKATKKHIVHTCYNKQCTYNIFLKDNK